MGEYRRVLFDIYIRKEYHSYITDVYKNMDWKLFPDLIICSWTTGRLNGNERMLLFLPDTARRRRGVQIVCRRKRYRHKLCLSKVVERAISDNAIFVFVLP